MSDTSTATPPPPTAPSTAPSPVAPDATRADALQLTDFLDVSALQEIQDGFAAIANVKATITDAAGNVLTSAQASQSYLQKQAALASQEESIPEPQRVGREYVAPILVGPMKLGQIRMRGGSESTTIDEGRAHRLAQKFNLDAQTVKDLVAAATKDKNRRPAAVQFLFLLANAIARLCYQEYQLRQRVRELEAVATLTVMLNEARDLQRVLDRTCELIARTLNCKAASIRLIDEEKDELVIKSVFNLSAEYISKGKIAKSKASAEIESLIRDGWSFVKDMRTDSNVQYPAAAAKEGIVSMLSAAMRHQGKLIGLLRVYTAEQRTFTPGEVGLLKAVAAAAGSAIEATRLREQARESEMLEQQINMAAEVQQRLIPQTPPILPGVDLASLYVPCYQLGGDLYDFIPLPYDNLGLVIADVSGKGVPASLIMAMVRAALRAQVDNVYYLSEVMRRINLMLVRDTKNTEFVTLFYGVLDSRNKRLTYCNAGHHPAMLLRDGKVIELGGGNEGSIVLGVLETETFKQNFIDLQTGDILLLFTDGLIEARNFSDEQYGKQRIIDSLKRGGTSADMVAKNVLWDLRRFTGFARNDDDVTIVTARIL
ncbi:MAG: SpoIIE family protein phosphatase [Tepidisphaeraceae bacterium]